MPSECYIFFDNLDGVYYSGSHVSGRFELTTTSSKNIRGISVHITGAANVCWEKEKPIGSTNEVQIIEYINNELVFNDSKYVLGSEYSYSFELSPGTYDYTFNCDLPINLPSSFTGLYGEIIYEVCVEIDKADIHTYNNKFKQTFTVIYSLDLNSSPDYRQPSVINEDVDYTCWVCIFGSGTVEAELAIPHCGYVAGQNIPYKLLISNDTNSDLNNTAKIELIKKVTFESQTPEKEIKVREVSLDEKDIGHTLRFTKKEFKNILEIPTVPPSTPNHINCCIRIEYFIKVEIITDCCADILRLNFPITIGAIPLIGSELSNEVILLQPSAPNWQENAFGALRNLDLPPGYIGPPSYDDSKNKLSEKFLRRQISIDRELSEHVPKYPVFSNNTPQTSATIEDEI